MQEIEITWEPALCTDCAGQGNIDTFKIRDCSNCNGSGFDGYQISEEEAVEFVCLRKQNEIMRLALELYVTTIWDVGKIARDTLEECEK